MTFSTRVESVQVGTARSVGIGRQAKRSGIDKRPVQLAVVNRNGIADDAIVADYHGGPGQAVYLYAREDYVAFERELKVDLAPGAFGENVTLGRLPEDPHVGDRLSFQGGVEIEFTGPRSPCVTFAARMSEILGPSAARGWVKRFTEMRRPGIYCRVLTEGELRPGEEAVAHANGEGNITVMELWDLMHDRSRTDLVAKGLTSPVDESIREWLIELAEGRCSRTWVPPWRHTLASGSGLKQLTSVTDLGRERPMLRLRAASDRPFSKTPVSPTL
jgi:MOSC domain-containing protein YiiM